MEEERRKWLAEVGIIEFSKPLKYFCSLGTWANPHTMYYSAEYIEQTPLEELKKGFKKNFAIGTFD